MKLNLKKYTKKDIIRTGIIFGTYHVNKKMYETRIENGEHLMFVLVEILLIMSSSLSAILYVLKDIRKELEELNARN